MRLVIIVILFLQAACATTPQQAQKIQRQPIPKSRVTLTSPTQYEHRETHIDPKTDEPVTYDPKPRVEAVDVKAGKYAFTWIGYDGKEKVIMYQRPDAIDIILSASVTKMSDGKYLYTYNIHNLPDSKTYLSWFTVQTFAQDVRPVRLREGVRHLGRMSNAIRFFKDGYWITFGSTYFREDITPGRSIDVNLESSAPPGLVGCSLTGGKGGLKGVGEHMPTELENAIPGYEAWLRSYTIGPIENLENQSAEERTKYVLESLPLMQQLGWITEDAARWYKRNLNGDNLSRVQKRAAQDLKAEQITSEVFAMIEAIN
ncbi:MAG: hypothetical protein MSG64_09735 [Pyrinomonadaceae bacterium MAG19_C2-C3]|nr:hypothetical protein [Pyrinomonadaceae bacterium MAG19_C2-C3]